MDRTTRALLAAIALGVWALVAQMIALGTSTDLAWRNLAAITHELEMLRGQR